MERYSYQRTQERYESFLRNLLKDRDDGTFCDLEIDCGERRFRAHRNVVCLHSAVIREALFREWKKEPTCGVFEIKEPSHILVRRMLDYIYTGDYDDFDSSIFVQKDHLSLEDVAKLETADHVPLHVKMMELGDTDKFTKHLASLLTRPVIVDIIPKVYALRSGLSDVIRNIVIDDMKKRLILLRTLATEELLEDVMRDVPQFTRDLLKSYMATSHGSYQVMNTYPTPALLHLKHYHSFVRTIAKDCDDVAFCDLEIVCGERRFPAHRNVEAARGVFEIKETSHMLVRRMLDYIYTGDYDDFDSSILMQKDHLSPQQVHELDIVDYLALHLKMMELGDMYMVEGLSQLANEKFAKHLASQTARDILVTIVPEVYALTIDSSDTTRKVVIDCMTKKMSPLPLADDVEESLEDVAKNVPEFTCELFKSYMKVCDDYRMKYFPEPEDCEWQAHPSRYDDYGDDYDYYP
ncbi:hypothetical protein E4U36_003233 [Claviceps purpurea]|nr:hypothetical protein E4U36_003233 [Claviceps purpurea]